MTRIILSAVLSLIVSAGRAQTAVQVWAQRYTVAGETNNEATAMAVDSRGNVFVTGISYNAPRTVDLSTTIAYSRAGTPLWTNRYSGPAGTNDYATAMAVDGDGNVVVTGYSASTNRYPYNYDFTTIKYSNSGAPLWTNRCNGPANSDDFARAVAVDINGDAVVTGYAANSSSYPFNYDYLTVKYSSAGVPLWTNSYNGSGNGDDQAQAVGVDRDGNVFVTGSSVGLGSSSDYVTIAYSGTGVPLWTNRYNGPGNGGDFAYALAVGAEGQVFVTGTSLGIGTYGDYATLAYSTTGEPLWTNRYNGPGNSGDYALALAVDSSNSVYVTGRSVGASYDFATIKYSSDGVAQWTNIYNGPGNSDDTGVGTAIDRSGNLFVTGYSFTSASHYDYATIGYSNAGVPLWTNRYDGPGNSTDFARAIAVDGDGNVFVTGYSTDSGGGTAYLTLRYSVKIPLAIQRMDGEVVLSWTNAAFVLQSAPAINGAFTNVPAASSPYTNALTGVQQFFRLISD